MEKIVKLIRDAKSFLVTTHYLPDGDGLGSQMAFHFALRALGKISHVVNGSPTPEKFQIADPSSEIRVYTPGDALPKVDLVVVMDTSDFAMLGPMEAPLRALTTPIVFIDHHMAEIAQRREHLIDENFGSTGELVYTLLTALDAPIDEAAATSLYTAIITDTNHFRFKRTSANSHRIAAALLEKGVLPEKVYQTIYVHDSLAKVRLFGQVLRDMESTPDGRIVWLNIPASLRHQHGATIEDTESFVNQLTLMKAVEIGIVFREDDDGRIKISIRGTGDKEVYSIAKAFGGGGHLQAAGMKVRGSLDEVRRRVLAAAQELLRNSGGSD